MEDDSRLSDPAAVRNFALLLRGAKAPIRARKHVVSECTAPIDTKPRSGSEVQAKTWGLPSLRAAGPVLHPAGGLVAGDQRGLPYLS
jgi:hypothetical protein